MDTRRPFFQPSDNADLQPNKRDAGRLLGVHLDPADHAKKLTALVQAATDPVMLAGDIPDVAPIVVDRDGVCIVRVVRLTHQVKNRPDSGAAPNRPRDPVRPGCDD